MKLQEECIPCIVNQAIKVANLVGMTDKNELLQKTFKYLSEVDYSSLTSPELIGENFCLLKELTGNPDPYKGTREKYNKMFFERIPYYEAEIDKATNPFSEAIKYAIIGNVIDFNPIHELTIEEVNKKFDSLKAEELEIDDTNDLLSDIEQAKSILYLGDNCGEICLDKIVLKKIKVKNPDCQLFFATRGTPIVNDSVMEDAQFVGIDEYATVVSNGDSSLGTVLARTSEEFNEIYNHADVILAKGQANYECLSDEKKNIYFLLMTKCDVIASYIGVPEMKMICMKSAQRNC